MRAHEPPTDQALPPAGIARRLGAMFYDGLLLLGVTWAVTALEIALKVAVVGADAVRESGQRALGGPLLQLSLLVVVFLFFGWFWTRSGQTLGMQAWRIRLDSDDGGRISWPQALVRFAGAAVSAACLGAGYWWMLVDRERLTWHDRWSRSRVVRMPRR